MASRLLNQAPVYLDDAGAPVAGGTLYFYVNGDTNTPKNVYGDKALSVNLGATELLDAGGRAVNDIWLDGSYTVILKTAGDVQVWARDDVEAPSELPSQTSNGGKALFTDGTDASWEEVLELPDYSGANDDDVLKIVSGEPFWGAPDPVPDYAGAVLEQPVLLNERTTSQAVTATATLAINYALGSVVELAQATNITTLTFGNFGAANKWARMLIVRTKDNSGTARTIAWGSVKWAGGTPPSLTSTANAIDVIELWSNGTTVLGFSRGLAMA
jgi:hypothetical protein